MQKMRSAQLYIAFWHISKANINRVLSRLLCSSQPSTCPEGMTSWRKLPQKLGMKSIDGNPNVLSTASPWPVFQSLHFFKTQIWVHQICLDSNFPPKAKPMAPKLSNRTYEAPLSLHQGSFDCLSMENAGERREKEGWKQWTKGSTEDF